MYLNHEVKDLPSAADGHSGGQNVSVLLWDSKIGHCVQGSMTLSSVLSQLGSVYWLISSISETRFNETSEKKEKFLFFYVRKFISQFQFWTTLSEIPGLYIWRARDNYMSLRRFCGISYIR
jgi:hypothetical protein